MAVASVVVPAGCTCSQSHTLPVADGGPATDSGRDSEPRDDASRDASAADGSFIEAGPPPCEIICDTGSLAAGYAPAGFVPFSGGAVEILATASTSDGGLHALVAAGPNEVGLLGRQWVLASVAAGGTRFEVGDQRTWPELPAGTLEGTGNGINAAALSVTPDGIEATVLFTVRESPTGPSAHDIRVGRIVWDPAGTLIRADDVGSIVVLPDANIAGASVFSLPSGEVIAAVEREGSVEGVRVRGSAIVERLDLGTSETETGGVGPLSGIAINDEQWFFAGGGRSWNGDRTPFANGTTAGEPTWYATLPGANFDPPPQLARSGDVGVVLQWHQRPDDIDNATLRATRLLGSGPVDTVVVPTPRLPLPLDVYAGSADVGAYGIWSVRAPDEFDDTLVYVVLLDGRPDCRSTYAANVARMRGAAGTASIHAAPVGEDLAMFGLPRGESGLAELTALRLRCRVE